MDQLYLEYEDRNVLEVDIQGFFGSLSHECLKKFLRLRIGDARVLKLIEAWLGAGILENGQRQESGDQGTPQGGSISPLLANIYLHYVLDLWFEKKIKQQCNGRAKDSSDETWDTESLCTPSASTNDISRIHNFPSQESRRNC